ncbi:hypothetical protein F8O05_09545 [Gulosibacter chungangensis]|uniref:Uncharacterized protein n=1 Tax=Gulosibacter chungangensis TaxID=979746 RepID=A0A7J5BB59_9MICO|nr:hypothetical protein [Gulosibacter chungangensis]KAB1642694.1 hypothetical protein F8O05_09545 [Gulosibacter chungangensis]
MHTHRWDWHEDLFLAGDQVQPAGLIVVEGCGAISQASRPLLDAAVWLEAVESIRHTRAITRDGDETWWRGWRDQEDAFYARERSQQLADFTLGPDVGVDELLSLLREARG